MFRLNCIWSHARAFPSSFCISLILGALTASVLAQAPAPSPTSEPATSRPSQLSTKGAATNPALTHNAATTAPTAKGPIFTTLDKAKATFRQSVSDSKKTLISAIDARIAANADTGDLSVVKSLRSCKAAVEANAGLPDGVTDPAVLKAGAAYRKDVAAANVRLAAAYREAIRSLTKARQFDQAEGLQTEMDDQAQLADGAAATSDPNAQVDLTKLVDPKLDTVAGQWVLEGAELCAVPPQAAARVVIPASTGGDYDLHIEFVRLSGTNDVNIYLPVGGRETMLLLSGWGGKASGLDFVDGKGADSNETGVLPGTLVNGKPYTLDISVRIKDKDAKIAVRLNNSPYIDWAGAQSGLSLRTGLEIPGHTFGLGSYNGTVRFTAVKLRMVSGELKLLRGRDAETSSILASTDNLAKCRLKSAIYGNGNDVADVTGQVAALLRNGGTVPVMNEELGDPAPNLIKTLKMDFAIGTQTVSLSGMGGTSISIWKVDDKIAGESMQISDNVNLESATCGSDSRPTDVRAVAAALLKSKKPVPNDWTALGIEDPAPNAPKILTIRLKIDGASYVFSVLDGGRISLDGN